MGMVYHKIDLSLIKETIVGNVFTLADSLKDGIDPSKRNDFIKGVVNYVLSSVKYNSRMDKVPNMGPLLEYKFYESYRDEVEWIVWFDLSCLSFLH